MIIHSDKRVTLQPKTYCIIAEVFRSIVVVYGQFKV